MVTAKGLTLPVLLFLSWLFFARGVLAKTPALEDLTQMSLADLSRVEVTSVSKTTESLQRASASIYVISHDEIERSGVTSVPEALRLAPNLLVTQNSSSGYVISARGFGGNPSSQNFSNKLLILIDGRSVYTPLYSGVYANTLDVLLEDIDRIEVISGVGATLWGANAMNGVINIITRPSYLTTGSLVDVGGGNQGGFAGGRYGGRINAETTLRLYGLGFRRGPQELADGSSAHDGWSKGQAGFRADWSTEPDSVTVQGDIYRGTENGLGTFDSSSAGANLLARYRHRSAMTDTQVQGYFDQTQQFAPAGGSAFVVHTYDLEFQQTVAVGPRHRLVWGGGERLYSYGITNTETFLFEPSHRDLTLGNVFAQDTVFLTGALNAVVGVKLEDDPYSGWTALPDVRLTWSAGSRATLWAAASRAIRSPTPFDTDVIEKLGTLTYLAARTNFRAEDVRAYELGVRLQPGSEVYLSAAVFLNDYRDLRTVELNSTPSSLPLYWGNQMRGRTYGLDAWASWQATDWWRLSTGFAWVRERLKFQPGAVEVLGVGQAADDPSSHASLSSSVTLPDHWNFDASLRYVGALPDPALPHYYDLDVRLGWKANTKLEFSLRGSHLLHSRHLEQPLPADSIARSVMAEARLRF